MQVKKIMPSTKASTTMARKPAPEELQQEFNYMQAEKITKRLLSRGLISSDEFDKIMAENKRTFPIFLAPIL